MINLKSYLRMISNDNIWFMDYNDFVIAENKEIGLRIEIKKHSGNINIIKYPYIMKVMRPGKSKLTCNEYFIIYLTQIGKILNNDMAI